MLTNRTFVIISSIDWNFNWQGPQEIASRLAKENARVLFIENTGVRSFKLKDTGRIWKRLKQWQCKFASKGYCEVEPNLYVCSPLVLPPFGSRLQKDLNRSVFLTSVKKICRRLQIEDPTILTFLPTDTASDLIKLLRNENGRVVYYVAGDFKELVSNPEELSVTEKEIVSMCDAVLTICSKLTNRYKSANREVYTLPYGVNLSAFENNKKTLLPEKIAPVITEIRKDARPVIGYVGAFHRHMDVDLLARSIEQRKDWRWIFVGPAEENTSKLRRMPNVSFLGQHSHDDLKHFIDAFDVCIIPYLNTRYTGTVVPVKLNEYLAAGKPVVSTGIPSVREFNRQHNIIKISENRADEFLGAIEEYLGAPETSCAIEKRKTVAALSDWQMHFERISQILISGSPETETTGILELTAKAGTVN